MKNKRSLKRTMRDHPSYLLIEHTLIFMDIASTRKTNSCTTVKYALE